MSEEKATATEIERVADDFAGVAQDRLADLGAAVGAFADAAGEAAMDAAGNLADAAAVQAGVAVDNLKKGADELSAKLQQMQSERQLRQLNPLKPEEYFSDDYSRPKLLIIEDADVRRGNELCRGAIGWTSTEAGTLVLHLYDTFVDDCGLSFNPCPKIGEAYYIDNFDKQLYISVDRYFDVVRQDMLTELSNIAYMLGAKECLVEEATEEKERSKGFFKAKAQVKAPVKADADIENSVDMSRYSSRRSIYKQIFEGSDNPQRPELHWFKYDKAICSLVEKRCSGTNKLSSYEFVTESECSAAMSSVQAAKLDAALSKVKGFNFNGSLKKETESSEKKRFVYHITF